MEAQEILFKEAASLEQMSEESQEWEELPSMNDLGMDAGGYALYETQVTVSGGKATLEIENVRDYAVVCLDGETVGELDNDSRSLTFQATDGTHTLQLYAETSAVSLTAPKYWTIRKACSAQPRWMLNR